MARTPRNYIADLNRLVASYRAGDLSRPVNRETYLRRMARQQAKAEAAGVPFSPQRARGHKPQEHRTPARQAYRERSRESARAARQERFIEEVSSRVSGDVMLRMQDIWAEKGADERDRIIAARNFAIRHPGIHSWDWYMEEYELEDDDIWLFGYH